LLLVQESTLEAGRERDEAAQQLEQERAQLQAVSQSQERMAQQVDALSQELAGTRQQLQQSQAGPLPFALNSTDQVIHPSLGTTLKALDVLMQYVSVGNSTCHHAPAAAAEPCTISSSLVLTIKQ